MGRLLATELLTSVYIRITYGAYLIFYVSFVYAIPAGVPVMFWTMSMSLMVRLEFCMYVC